MNDSNLTALAHAGARATMAYPFKVWGFGEGIALEALWQASDVLDEPAYRAFVLDLFEHWLAREIVEADHSAPGGLLVEAYQHTGDERYLVLALKLAAHMHSLPRDATGALFHRPTHPDYHDYLYVDCMEVDAPFLCALARATGDTSFYDRAADQLLGYCALLQDSQIGLFYHQYNGSTAQVNGDFWGRGNAWALLGMLKTLLLLPPTHSAYRETGVRFTTLAVALAERQLASGDWPTVLDKPDTYRESSLSAMFGYGLDVAIHAGLLPVGFAAVADKAWNAMLTRLTPDGLLHGVSMATPPGNAAHYNTIATGSGYPWAQGPVLLGLLHRLRH